MLPYGFEIILVEDGSPDRFWKAIEKLVSHTKGIHPSLNHGQHKVLLCGIRKARYDTIITMTDDLQHPVIELPVLLAKLGEGYDPIYGAPHPQ